jgi:hypothetical protein
MFTPIYESAKITSRTPGVKLVITHEPHCRAIDGGHCHCDVRIRIVRPAKKVRVR